MPEQKDLRKIEIKSEDFRRDLLQNVFGDSPVYGADEEYSFFYDESGNIRKLRANEAGFNVEPSNFILGGLVHLKSKPLENLEELVKRLRIQKTATEISLDQIATGQYLGMLNSKRLVTFLEWILDNEVYIHYGRVNPLYWALVDIIDSATDDLILSDNIGHIIRIKGELFRLARMNLNRLSKLLYVFGFPNIKPELGKQFMLQLADLLEKSAGKNLTGLGGLVVRIVKSAATLPELPFITGHEKSDVVDSFNDFYLRPVYTFPQSKHVFDNETTIQETLRKFEVTHNDAPVLTQFMDSKNSLLIQLSDVTCGLLRSHFNYMDEHSFDYLVDVRRRLNPAQVKCVNLLRNIIIKSDAQSNGFTNTIAAVDGNFKSQAFLKL